MILSRSLGSEDDGDSDESVEETEDRDTVELLDTFDDLDDRADRQLVFRRPLRPRFPVVNPAAAALIPAIPTFVGEIQRKIHIVIYLFVTPDNLQVSGRLWPGLPPLGSR